VEELLAQRGLTMAVWSNNSSRFAASKKFKLFNAAKWYCQSMRKFLSSDQAQRYLIMHGLTQNLFRLSRHLLQAVNYRQVRPILVAAC
jgi:hypothetical protein